MSDLESYRDFADDRLAKYTQAKATRAREKRLLRDVEQRHQDALEAQRIVQAVAQSVQQQAHDRIAKVVSRCLAAVFTNPYEFKILFEKKRGKTEARLVFYRDGHELDPMDQSGYGVIDVGAFALQLADLLLRRPRRRRLLVLDEPFRHLSRDNADRVKDLLLTLAKEMKVQFVMVTHSLDLACGKVVEL